MKIKRDNESTTRELGDLQVGEWFLLPALPDGTNSAYVDHPLIVLDGPVCTDKFVPYADLVDGENDELPSHTLVRHIKCIEITIKEL